jgi:hypothetical protein
MLSRKHEQPLHLVTGAAKNFSNPRRSCRTDPPPSLRISDFQPLFAPISHTTTHSAKSKDFLTPPSLTVISSLPLHPFFFPSFSASVLPSLTPISKLPAQASHAPLPFSPPQNHKPRRLH